MGHDQEFNQGGVIGTRGPVAGVVRLVPTPVTRDDWVRAMAAQAAATLWAGPGERPVANMLYDAERIEAYIRDEEFDEEPNGR